MTELFQSGQAVIAVWGTGRVQSFANTGFPVDFVYPKEGAATLLATACPIAKPNASPLASSFIKMLLDPEIQLVLLKDYGYGPVLKSTGGPAGARQDGADRRDARQSSIIRTGRHQRQARGMDQALESRGRALTLIGMRRQLPMAYLELDRVSQAFGDADCRRRLQSSVGKGEFVSLPRPVRLRQDHDPADDRGLRRSDHAARSGWTGRDLTAVQPAKRGLGIVFQSYALFPHMTAARERRVRPRDARRAEAERDRARDARRWRWSGSPASRPLSAPHVRRPAAARRAGARAGDQAERAAAGRAAVQSRRQAARGDADRAARRSSAPSAPPRSSSPTIRARRWRCPTASW